MHRKGDAVLNLEEHRAFIRSYLPSNAFLRIDRSDSLFVTDAPRFAHGSEIQIPGYKTRLCRGVLHIIPEFDDVPSPIKGVMVSILKAGQTEKNRLIRTHLALALRKHDTESAKILEEMLEGVEVDEAKVDGARLL